MNKQSLISGEIKASWIILAVFILIVGGVFFWAGPFRGSQILQSQTRRQSNLLILKGNLLSSLLKRLR